MYTGKKDKRQHPRKNNEEDDCEEEMSKWFQ